MKCVNRATMDRTLWVVFAALFIGMVGTAWLPVKPIVWGLPFWAVVALVMMLVTVIVAGAAGWYYGWPKTGEPR